MKETDVLAKIALFIFAVLVIQFIYFGIVTSAQGIYEGDSVAYHIPIARELSKLNFIPPNLSSGLDFYPAAAEIMLSFFILLHIPLNLFGVLGFFLLFIILIKVAKSFGISNSASIVYATSVATLPSILRWPLTQTIDIWLTVFFLMTLNLLVNSQKTSKYFCALGVSAGMLVGSKFTGPLFFVILLIFFGKKVFAKTNFKNIIIFLIPFSLLGLGWYVRNFLLTGNPIYPANLFMFSGDPNFPNITSQNWSIAGNLIRDPTYVFKIIEAFIGEYLVWAFVPLIPIMFYIKKESDKALRDLSWVGFLVLVVFLFIPPAEPIVSNMRYIYPAMAVLILAVFKNFENKNLLLLSFSLLISIFSLINLDYHPKILILSFVPLFYFIFVKNWFFNKIEEI